MKYCSKCGNEVDSNSQFCVKCGSPIPTQTTYSPLPEQLSDDTTTQQSNYNQSINNNSQSTYNNYRSNYYDQQRRNFGEPVNNRSYSMKKTVAPASTAAHFVAVLLTLIIIPITLSIFTLTTLYTSFNEKNLNEFISSIDFNTLVDNFDIDVDAQINSKDAKFVMNFIGENIGEYVSDSLEGDVDIVFEKREIDKFISKNTQEIENIIGRPIDQEFLDNMYKSADEINDFLTGDFIDSYSNFNPIVIVLNHLKITLIFLIVLDIILILGVFLAYHKKIGNAFVALIFPHIISGVVFLGGYSLMTGLFFLPSDVYSVIESIHAWLLNGLLLSTIISFTISIACILLAVICKIVRQQR